MSELPKRLRIATRQSQLALWQTHFIQQELQRHYPTLTIELVLLSTRGDEVQDRSLAKVGGKGLFIKALEEALLNDQADIAVHSLKDVPALLDPRFTLAATPKRANPLDALISPHYDSLAALPHGARVGTSSPRRSAQLLAERPDLNIQLLRGNVDTRLAKCLRGDYDAIILACAGLERLGLAHHIRQPLPATLLLPAAGQGIMAVECLRHRQDLVELLAPLNHPETFAIMTAERALVQALNGDCHSAIGAYACVAEGELQLTGNVTSANGIRRLQAGARAPLTQAQALGERVAEQLLQQGAREILVEECSKT